MDINSMVQQKIDEYISTKLDKQITESIEAMLNKVISNLLSGYGKIANQIEDHLKEQLKIDLSKLSLKEYNQRLLVLISKSLDRAITEKGLTKMAADLERLLSGNIPEKVTMVDILKEMASDRCEDGDIFFEHSEISTGIASGYVHINIGRKIKYSQDKSYRLMIHKEESGLFSICSISMGGVEFTKTLVLGNLYGFEAYLFRLYSVGTMIDYNPDDVDIDNLNYSE